MGAERGTKLRLVETDDEREFTATLRRVFTTAAGDAALWKSLADVGVFGLTLSESRGGSGASLESLGAFCVEAGRHLCPIPVYGNIFAALAVDVLDEQGHVDWFVRDIVTGKRVAATALWSAVDAGDVTPGLTAQRLGADWRLSGSIDFVLDAASADYLLVSGHDDDFQTHVFVVPTKSHGLQMNPLVFMGGQNAAQLTFDRVLVSSALGGRADTPERLRTLANTAVALLSLDLVGVGEAAMRRAVEYTCTRQQFGRAIASFQAAQHLVANMHIALAAARLAGWAAIAALSKGPPADRQVAVARMHAAAAAKHATLDAHQLHGGMGYVIDSDLHRYSERARVLSTLGGGADVAATWLRERRRER